MGKTTIAWCDFTFNPWIGCQKVSAGCNNCYAETLMATRYHRVEWGQRKTDETDPSVGTRVRTSEANWRLPGRWNKKAAADQEAWERAPISGRSLARPERPRVFCASLADWLDNQVPESWREDLACLIDATPNLDWLLLTKRIENFDKLAPWHDDDIPSNVWLGITAEDQDAYDKRWPILARIPARVRFVSYEPALGPLTIKGHKEKPEWLICGGESGKGYRDMKPRWATAIGIECEEFSVAFFFKQMAGLKPIPDDLLIRQFPAGSSR